MQTVEDDCLMNNGMNMPLDQYLTWMLDIGREAYSFVESYVTV